MKNLKDSDDEEYDASEYPQRVGRQKHLLDIDIHFNDARRSGGGRGPRGPRAGGPRGNRNNQRAAGGGAGAGAGAGEKQGSRYRGNEEQVSYWVTYERVQSSMFWISYKIARFCVSYIFENTTKIEGYIYCTMTNSILLFFLRHIILHQKSSA